MIGIIDYGMGNIHSVQKALESLGAEVAVINTPQEAKSAQKLVLPGVGAFDDAFLELEKKGLVGAIKEHVKSGKVFLGICLGMQFLFEKSEEARKQKGLGIFRGEVKRFSNSYGLKVPHMGWNQLNITHNECPLLQGIDDNAYVYFCHSYYPAPADKEVIAASTDYGVSFASVVWQDNVYGVQFHPEKSQATGIQMLKNFVELSQC